MVDTNTESEDTSDTLTPTKTEELKSGRNPSGYEYVKEQLIANLKATGLTNVTDEALQRQHEYHIRREEATKGGRKSLHAFYVGEEQRQDQMLRDKARELGWKTIEDAEEEYSRKNGGRHIVPHVRQRLEKVLRQMAEADAGVLDREKKTAMKED